jgi:cytochrome c biogenesis protein CcdA/glutaredoxin
MNHMKIKLYKNIIISLVLTIMVMLALSAYKCEAKEQKKIIMVYFYINVCKSCNEAEKSLNELSSIIKESGKNISPDIRMYNIENSRSYELLLKYIDYYKVPKEKGTVPILFLGNKYFQGKDEIEKGLKDVMSEDNIILETPILASLKINSAGLVEEKFSKINGIGVFFTGLVNGFNPCSLSMLLFFLSVLIARKGRIIGIGITFCLGKFIAYLALGTVMYKLLSTINMELYSTIIKVIMGAVILVIVVFNLRDYLAARKEQYEKIRMQLPKALRKKNHNWIKKLESLKDDRIIILLSFILGALIAVGEFLCTGQLYLATIIYILQNNPVMNMKALVYLLMYDLAFILPLVAVIIAVNRGREIFDISELFREKLAAIKLITAIAFLILGIIMVFLL